MHHRSLIAGLVAAAALSLSYVPAFAETQPFPSRPITWVVPFPAGGSADIVARTLGKELSDAYGQSVIIENVPGATGGIGARKVARADPDGYTILLLTSSIAISQAIKPSSDFSLQDNFRGVSPLSMTPNLLVAYPGLPIQNLQDLIAYGKAGNPLNFGSPGVGSAVHLAQERLKHGAGLTTMHHIPYKGSSQSLTDLAAGNIQIAIDQMISTLPLVKSGKARAIAVTSPERSPLAPDIPTVAEQGLPGFQSRGWFGVLAPAGTPEDVVQSLNRQLATILAKPDIRKKFQEWGMSEWQLPPDEFFAFVGRDASDWKQVVEDTGLVLN